MPMDVETVTLHPWQLADASPLWAEAMADIAAGGAAPVNWADAVARACSTDPLTVWRTVRRCSDAARVGAVGLQPSTDLPNAFELCWWIVPSWRRRGCGKAAVTQLIADVRPQIGNGELLAVIRPDNAPSIELATSCGLVADSSTALTVTRGLVYRVR